METSEQRNVYCTTYVFNKLALIEENTIRWKERNKKTT